MRLRAGSLAIPCLVALLAGCASNAPAPVVDRSPPTAVERPAAPELKPGEYLVKKGDTLRSIALDYGQDYRDIATWNNLDNPNLIRVGQVLKIKPPEGDNATGVETRPVAPPISIESRSVDSKATPATAPSAVTVANVDAIKREPKGGTQPYSDEAWAQLQKPATPPAATVPAPAVPAVPAVKAPESTKPIVATEIDWGWPTTKKPASNFSDDNNKGIDFSGAVGDPVLAAAAGKVTLVTNSLRGYGNLIVVKHNTTYLSVYAHNSKMLVTEGQTVSKGQKIAEVGSSDSDRPGLHFEIRREGKPVDPAKFLPQR